MKTLSIFLVMCPFASADIIHVTGDGLTITQRGRIRDFSPGDRVGAADIELIYHPAAPNVVVGGSGRFRELNARLGASMSFGAAGPVDIDAQTFDVTGVGCVSDYCQFRDPMHLTLADDVLTMSIIDWENDLQSDLIFTYDVTGFSTAVPEPTALAVLLIGLPLIVRRFR